MGATEIHQKSGLSRRESSVPANGPRSYPASRCAALMESGGKQALGGDDVAPAAGRGRDEACQSQAGRSFGPAFGRTARHMYAPAVRYAALAAWLGLHEDPPLRRSHVEAAAFGHLQREVASAGETEAVDASRSAPAAKP